MRDGGRRDSHFSHKHHTVFIGPTGTPPADAGAVLGYAVQIHQPLLAEDGDGVGEQGVEGVEVPDADVSQGVVVHRHPAAQPAEGVVFGTQGGEGTGGTDAFEGGVHPQGDGQSGVEGRATGPPFAGGTYCFPSSRSTTEHPRTCGPSPRQCARMSGIEETIPIYEP